MADVKAVTRIEAILNGEDITPVTREEAILSGADVEPLSREEYFVQKRLAGGGGGLEYVIPEQTFQPLSNNTADNAIQVNAENLVNGDTVAMTVTIQISQQSLEATTPIYGEFSVTEEETSISANTGMFDIIIATEDNINWFIAAMDDNGLKTFYKLVIKAIKY